MFKVARVQGVRAGTARTGVPSGRAMRRTLCKFRVSGFMFQVKRAVGRKEHRLSDYKKSFLRGVEYRDFVMRHETRINIG